MFICIITCVLFIVSTVRMVSVKHWMKSQISVLESKKQELDEETDNYSKRNPPNPPPH